MRGRISVVLDNIPVWSVDRGWGIPLSVSGCVVLRMLWPRNVGAITPPNHYHITTHHLTIIANVRRTPTKPLRPTISHCVPLLVPNRGGVMRDQTDWRNKKSHQASRRTYFGTFVAFCGCAIYACVPNLCLSQLWNHVCTLVLHSHSWVRLLSVRIIGQYFSLIETGSPLQLPSTLLESEHQVYKLSKRLASALDSDLLNETIGTQVNWHLLMGV